MKRIFTLIFGLSAALIANSQSKQYVNGEHIVKHKPMKANADDVRSAIDQGAADMVVFNTQERGSAFFTEDFANGFDGNNAFGFWTFEDSGGNTIWMMADADSPAGVYSTPAEALQSTTADNGWVIFDCDLYQGGEISDANPAEDVSGYLTSPTIDMSTASSAILEFEQTFRYCCADAKPLWVEVTNDGGNSWYVFDAAPDFTLGANETPSANPYVTQVDISGVAAYQSSVQFRFAWQPNGNSTHSHYYWGIDDVTIMTNPIENDVEVSYLALGDIQNDFEFRVIPLEQARPDGMVFGTVFTNIGTNAHSATVLVEVLDASQALIDSWSETFDILPNALLPNPADQLDTFYLETGWIPSAIGTYFARTTITTPEGDDTPNNNTLSRRFFVTAAEYGHDDATAGQLNSQMEPVSGDGSDTDPYPPTGYGSYFNIYNPGSTAYGITVRFDETTTDFTPISILLQKQGDDYNLTDADYVTGGEYDVQVSWVPSTSFQSFPIYIPFETTADLEEENLYFAGIQTIDEGTDKLAVRARAEVDRDFSTGTWAETTEGDFIWFFGLGSLTDFTPAIRLALDDLTSVEEMAKIAGLNNFQINPNPVVNTANLMFTLDGPHFVAYEVRDITGKLMSFKNIGQMSGTNNYSLDVSALAVGNYMVNLVIDGEHVFPNKMSVTK